MRVLVGSSTTCYHYEHDGEEYGSWSRSNSFSIDSVRVARDDEQEPYGTDGFLIPDGSDIAYVLSMTYSTGDSFGKSDGEGAILGCFGSLEVARAAKAAVEANEDNYSIEVVDDFGRSIKMTNPGAGYFESIGRINIQLFPLHKSKFLGYKGISQRKIKR